MVMHHFCRLMNSNLGRTVIRVDCG